jgi:hypothetical protein
VLSRGVDLVRSILNRICDDAIRPPKGIGHFDCTQADGAWSCVEWHEEAYAYLRSIRQSRRRFRRQEIGGDEVLQGSGTNARWRQPTHEGRTLRPLRVYDHLPLSAHVAEHSMETLTEALGLFVSRLPYCLGNQLFRGDFRFDY